MNTTGTDTVEAFTALAVNDRIPTDVFRATMQKFDLRMQLYDTPPAQIQGEDNETTQDSSKSRTNNGIDLTRFSMLLSDDDGTKKRDTTKRRFSRLSSVQQESLQHVSESFEGVPSPDESRTPVCSPKPLDALLSQVRNSMNQEPEWSVMRRDMRNDRSPLRHEVFPFRFNKKKWEFAEVAKRIEEVEALGDVRRSVASRNARYCSHDRPRLARITPFSKLDGEARDSHPASFQARHMRLPPRGLPENVERLNHRSVSVPLTDRFPILAKRRERLMDQIPHRKFESNGSVPWSVSAAQRASIASLRLRDSGSTGADPTLRHMAAATLAAMHDH
jgi:hypothetical protein